MKYFFPFLVSGRLLWPQIPRQVVLVFHHLGPRPSASRLPGQYHFLHEISSAIQQLKERGYQPADLDQLADPPDGQRRFAVTLDDGYAAGLEELLDVLKKHRTPATQFLVGARLGQTNRWDEQKGEPTARLMDSSQIRRWIQAGHAVGAHSMNHPNLRHLDDEGSRKEIEECRLLLENEFQKPVRHFAYPYGGHGTREEGWVQAAGYRAGWSLGPQPAASRWARPRWSPRTPGMLAGFFSVLGRSRR
jgi:peptidoglycan/xylan/chitin deacetylase (PgdA/CDA1 family)